MTTGERIRAARKKAKMTQAALGTILGVSGSMVAQYEANTRHPKIETLNRIATALNISRSEITGLSDVEDFYVLIESGVDVGLLEHRLQSEFGFDEETSSKVTECAYDSWKHCFRTQEEAERKQWLDRLNDAGKAVADERIRELTEIPKYKK